MKKALWFSGAVLAFAAVVLAAAPAARAEEAPTEDELLKAKCSLCHTFKRIYVMDREKIKPVLERMQKMNPDWITDVERDHVAEVLAKVLGDTGVLAIRTAWNDAVERGAAMFQDATLGKSGKSCASCHASGSLRHVADAYPQFNLRLKRFVDINEAINLMIKEKVGGEPFPVNDARLLDLVSYLKTLK